MTDQTVSKTCPQVVQNQVKWAIKPFWELEKVFKYCCFEVSVVSLQNQAMRAMQPFWDLEKGSK